MFMSPEGVKKLEIHLLTCPILPNWRKATSKPGKKYTSLLTPEYCFLTDFDQGFQNQINLEHAMKTNYVLAFLKENMPS